MKEFFKNNYKKIICSFVLICILSLSVISAFAVIPNNGIQFSQADLVFNNIYRTQFYRYIIERYNSNMNDSNPIIGGTSGNATYYSNAYFPEKPSYPTSDMKNALESTWNYLTDEASFDEYNNIYDYIEDFEMLYYYDEIYNKTIWLYIPTFINNINYYYKLGSFVRYSIDQSGVTIQGKSKILYTLNATANGIANASASPYAFRATISNNGKSITFDKISLASTQVLFAVEDILYMTNGVRSTIMQNIDASTLFNYYNYNSFNQIVAVNFTSIKSVIPVDSNPQPIGMLAQPNNIGIYDEYYLTFDIYTYSQTNINWSKYLESCNFITDMQSNPAVGNESVEYIVLSYNHIGTSIYSVPNSDLNLYVYSIKVIFKLPSTPNNIKGSDFSTFQILYPYNINVYTPLDNNELNFNFGNQFGFQNTLDLEALWDTFESSFDLLSYIASNLYNLMPYQVYSLLTIAISIVIIIGGIRLVI